MTTTCVLHETDTAPIARRLATILGKGRYNLWFRWAKLSLDEGTLEVNVANPFIADWIENHFHDQLLQAAQAQLGAGACVRIGVDPTCKAPEQAVQDSAQPPAPASSPPRHGPVPGALADLRHRLEEFVVGPTNELAFTAACRLVQEPQARLNPLFIHARCGMGKTHLLQGICRKFAQEHPEDRWLYTTAEQFTTAYVDAVRSNRLGEFRKHWRRLDLLAVDDVHFLANKTSTQTEFLHTFDCIGLRGARVVLASDAHPKIIQKLCAALISRFLNGMVVQIHQPDLETRRLLILTLAQRRNLVIADSVIQMLAARPAQSVREIEGWLTQLAALAALEGAPSGTPIGHLLASRLISQDTAPIAKRPVRLEEILTAVCTELRIERSELASRARHRRLVLARSISAFLARQLTTLSYPELASALGRQTHSTVISATRRIERQTREKLQVGVADHGQQTMDMLVDRLRRQITEGGQ